MTRRSQRGFTLVETVLSVVISSIIMGALVQATLIGLRTIDNSNQSLAGSNDTQLVASYFTGDVASAESVSLVGTTAHGAPSVAATAGNQLLTMTAMKTQTLSAPPSGMTEAWDLASDGPVPAQRFSIEMADAPVDAGPTGTRTTTSEYRTSSIAHTVALEPVGTISRRAVSTSRTPGATALTLTKPAGTAVNDMMIVHLAVSGGSDTVVQAPSGWTLVDSRTSGTALRSLVYRKVAVDVLTTSFDFTFNGAREAVGGIVSYVNVITTVNTKANAVNPCGGNTPVLYLTWTNRDDGVFNAVNYAFENTEGENRLVRSHCTGASNNPQSRQTLARILASSTAASAACQPSACTPLPVTVTLSVTEPPPMHESVGRTYQLSATTRTSS